MLLLWSTESVIYFIWDTPKRIAKKFIGWKKTAINGGYEKGMSLNVRSYNERSVENIRWSKKVNKNLVDKRIRPKNML